MSYVESLFGLNGRTAVVIGGSGVLGGRMAVALGKAGANVAILYHRNEQGARQHADEITAAGGTAIIVQCDTRSKEGLQQANAAVVQRFGAVHCVVNAPGVNSATPFFDIAESEWDAIVDANLKGMFLSSQVFAAQMKEQGSGGSIINISSVAAEIPQSKVAVYNISKAGVNSLTRFLAKELAPFRIRVNAVQPGVFPAEQNKKLLTQERTADILRHTPMQRFGEPQELSGVVVWLASEAASSFVTGSLVTVDGGFSAMRI